MPDDADANENPSEVSGDLPEMEFLRAYQSTSLWKPQVVADSVLTRLFLADATHRALLATLLMQEVAEAARRLNAVWLALADRSVPVVRSLRAPLPLATDWERLAEEVEGREPADLLAMLNLHDHAEESAAELAEFEGLRRFAVPIRVTEGGPPSVFIERDATPVMVLNGRTHDGEPVEARLTLTDDQVIALGDATGQFVTIARDFLASYIDARDGGAD